MQIKLKRQKRKRTEDLRMSGNEISYEIVKKIGVINRYPTGWSKEVNIVSWNEGQPKLDIRDWSEDHEKMSRGITLTADEAQRLVDSVQARDAITMLQNMTKPARTNDYER